MTKFSFVFCFVVSIFTFTSCGDDDSCKQSDWLGVYTLDPDSEECNSSGVSLSETILIVAGSDSNTIISAGQSMEFEGCEVPDASFGLSMRLNGNTLSVDILGCTGEYTRE